MRCFKGSFSVARLIITFCQHRIFTVQIKFRNTSTSVVEFLLLMKFRKRSVERYFAENWDSCRSNKKKILFVQNIETKCEDVVMDFCFANFALIFYMCEENFRVNKVWRWFIQTLSINHWLLLFETKHGFKFRFMKKITRNIFDLKNKTIFYITRLVFDTKVKTLLIFSIWFKCSKENNNVWPHGATIVNRWTTRWYPLESEGCRVLFKIVLNKVLLIFSFPFSLTKWNRCAVYPCGISECFNICFMNRQEFWRNKCKVNGVS